MRKLGAPYPPVSRSARANALGRLQRLFARRRSFAIRHYSAAEEELMTITKQDINAVLTRLTQAFPQAFVLNSTSRIGR